LATCAAPVQAVGGAVARLFPPSAAFPMITTGQSSATQFIKLINRRDDADDADKGDAQRTGSREFIETSNCPVALPPAEPSATTANGRDWHHASN
jgi:hypothetical protein